MSREELIVLIVLRKKQRFVICLSVPYPKHFSSLSVGFSCRMVYVKGRSLHVRVVEALGKPLVEQILSGFLSKEKRI